MPKTNKAKLPKTLRELDPPEPVGEVDAVHAEEFPDLYIDVQPQFGSKSETRRYQSLISRVPGRALGEPDLSGFCPHVAPSVEERWLVAAIAGTPLDAEARQAAVERLDDLRRAKRPKLQRGQHKGDERLSALRGELVLSIYACAGRTGVSIDSLLALVPIGEDWWKNHRSIPTAEQREETKRTGQLAFYSADGGFSYADPLKPSEWHQRHFMLTHDEPRDPPNEKGGS